MACFDLFLTFFWDPEVYFLLTPSEPVCNTELCQQTTTRELIFKIAAGNYTNEELSAFLDTIKIMDKASFLEAYHLLYEEINKYPAEALAPASKTSWKDDSIYWRLKRIFYPET